MSAFWDKKKKASTEQRTALFEPLDDSQLHFIAGGDGDIPQESNQKCWICESPNTHTELIDGQNYLICDECGHKSLEFSSAKIG